MDLWFRVSPLSARRGIFGIAQEPLSLPPENSRHHHGHNAASQRQLFTGSSSNRLNFYLLFILKEDFEEPPILLWTWVDQPWFSLHRLVWGNYSARQRAVHLPTHSHLMNHDCDLMTVQTKIWSLPHWRPWQTQQLQPLLLWQPDVERRPRWAINGEEYSFGHCSYARP